MPTSAANPRSTLAANRTTCVTRITRRRSTMSASVPATSPNSSVGAVLALWTSATISSDVVNVAISHAAIVACIV